MEPVMDLSEQELKVANALTDAAFHAATDYAISNQYAKEFHVSSPMDEMTARKLKPYFDLFHLAMGCNWDGIRRVMGTDKPQRFAKTYLHYVLQKTGVNFHTAERVEALQYRLQGYLKDIAATNKTQARKLYIADQHFYHDRLCHMMDQRGFSGFEEMNAHMIEQWNRKVTAKDEVYVLGDFSISRGEATNHVLEKLKGKLYLISGNHDRYLEDKSFVNRFRWVKPYAEIRDAGRIVILSHYPIFCYKGQYHRDKAGNPITYMLYGHVHNTHDERLVNDFIMQTRQARVQSRHADQPEPIPCNMINCFCMFSDYQPMTLDEWIRIDQKRRAAMQGSKGQD